jgi:DNA-binding transcriptional regulator YiaG
MWLPGQDYPYVMQLAGERAIAITLPATWVLLDKSGEVCLRPPAVRLLDRLRALFHAMPQSPTPGFIRTLRQAMNLTQEQMARRIGVNKITVSRWERGSMKPNPAAVKALFKLRSEALRRGLAVDAQAK